MDAWLLQIAKEHGPWAVAFLLVLWRLLVRERQMTESYRNSAHAGEQTSGLIQLAKRHELLMDAMLERMRLMEQGIRLLLDRSSR